MLASAVPATAELSDRIILELSRHGGHVGFVSGASPWQAVYWLEQRIPDFLAEHLKTSKPLLDDPLNAQGSLSNSVSKSLAQNSQFALDKLSQTTD